MASMFDLSKVSDPILVVCAQPINVGDIGSAARMVSGIAVQDELARARAFGEDRNGLWLADIL